MSLLAELPPEPTAVRKLEFVAIRAGKSDLVPVTVKNHSLNCVRAADRPSGFLVRRSPTSTLRADTVSASAFSSDLQSDYDSGDWEEQDERDNRQHQVNHRQHQPTHDGMVRETGANSLYHRRTKHQVVAKNLQQQPKRQDQSCNAADDVAQKDKRTFQHWSLTQSLRAKPERHIITLTCKNICRGDVVAFLTAYRDFIPFNIGQLDVHLIGLFRMLREVEAMPGNKISPEIDHKLKILAVLDLHSVRVILKRIYRPHWVSSELFNPLIVRTAIWAVLHIVCMHPLARLQVSPKRLRIFEVEKALCFESECGRRLIPSLPLLRARLLNPEAKEHGNG